MDAGIASTISVCLSGDGSCHYGNILQGKDFRHYRFLHPAGTFRHCLALSGRRQQTAIDFGNYLCSVVFSLLCYIYSRCKPFDIEKPADHETYLLCHFVRTIGYIVRLNFCTELQVIPSAWLWVDVLSLAILPTAVSLAVPHCHPLYSSTPTAILVLWNQ